MVLDLGPDGAWTGDHLDDSQISLLLSVLKQQAHANKSKETRKSIALPLLREVMAEKSPDIADDASSLPA